MFGMSARVTGGGGWREQGGGIEVRNFSQFPAIFPGMSGFHFQGGGGQ